VPTAAELKMVTEKAARRRSSDCQNKPAAGHADSPVPTLYYCTYVDATGADVYHFINLQMHQRCTYTSPYAFPSTLSSTRLLAGLPKAVKARGEMLRCAEAHQS
jgi:hypothetical protein